MRNELLSPEPAPDEPAEVEVEVGLRPRVLSDFVGQSELKGHLGVMLGAARQRGQAADHLLFAGPPGLGKTTLAHIVAAEMDAELHITSGPALERAAVTSAILTKLEDGDVFIDEICRWRAVEEVLPAGDGGLPARPRPGQGPATRSLRLDYPRFTLVGATTRTG
jgi:Holliday junction DNA helicase RuvB